MRIEKQQKKNTNPHKIRQHVQAIQFTTSTKETFLPSVHINLIRGVLIFSLLTDFAKVISHSDQKSFVGLIDTIVLHMFCAVSKMDFE